MGARAAYSLVTALNWFASVLPMAVTVLLAQSRGMTLADVGLFMGLFSVVVAVLELPSGAVADAIGRKRTFLAGTLVGLAARALCMFAFDLPAFLAFAVLLGVSRALTSGALEAWFVDALQAEDEGVDLQPALAAAGSWQLAGLALGTLAGGALPSLLSGLPAEGVLTPLSSPLLASLVAQALVLAVTAAVVVERRRAPGLRSGLSLGALSGHLGQAFGTVACSAPLRLLLVVDVVIGVALAASENLWQPHFAALLPGDAVTDGGTIALGALLAGSFAAGILGNVLATALSSALGKRHALAAAVLQVAQAAAFAGLAVAGGFPLAAAAFLGTYMFRSGRNSPHQALFNAEVSSDQRSVMLSVQSLASFAGATVGSVALGALAEARSLDVVWAVCAIAVGLSVLAYLRLDAQRAPTVAVGEPGVGTGA